MVLEVEREVKIALATRGDYEVLRVVLDNNGERELKAAILQLNRFYDDNDILKNAGAVLRMRKQLVIPACMIDIFSLMELLANPDAAPHAEVELTLKQKLAKTSADQDGLRESNEWTMTLPSGKDAWNDYGDTLPSKVELLFPSLPAATWQLLDGRTFQKWGGFKNYRYEYNGRQGELVCLDRTLMFDEVDHELEIETPDPDITKLYWSSLLGVSNVSWAWQNDGKAKRLRRRLNERKAAAL